MPFLKNMLYLENYRNQNKLVVVFDYTDIEEALFDLDFLMDLYLSQGVMFVYEIVVGKFGCNIIFHLKSNGF